MDFVFNPEILQRIVDGDLYAPEPVDAHEAVDVYFSAGWTAPLPLPKGSKFPPPVDTTGNIGDLPEQQIRALWAKKPGNSNVGLRLQNEGDFEIIALDVDHYGSKQGRLFLAEKEEALGDLNLHLVPYSTRRGGNNPSGQFFFKVPAGLKWEATACPSVDIVQRTHRYSAVWPSIVDGTQYRWYVGGVEIEVPKVADLPWLPEAWVRSLSRGERGSSRKPGQRKFVAASPTDNLRGAMGWLRENVNDFAAGDMSAPLRIMSDSEDFKARLTVNGHDTMVSSVHGCLKLAMEGHFGLKLALTKLYRNFAREVTTNRDGANLRTEKQAKKEFGDAVVSEVERIIASGVETPKELTDKVDFSGVRDALIDLEAEAREEGVDLKKYMNNDRGHAEMFVDYWREDVKNTGVKDKEIVLWNKVRGRWEFIGTNQAFHLMHRATAQRIMFECEKIREDINTWATKAESEQLPADIDLDDMQTYANHLQQRADGLYNTPGTLRVLKQLSSFPDMMIDAGSFDDSPNVIGLPDGMTLDVENLEVRKSLRRDMLTMGTKVLPSSKPHPVWEDFVSRVLPDPVMRRFAQKCLGYSLVDGNPEKLLFFLKGPANTGKTTLLDACAEALGDYGAPGNPSSLLSHQKNRPSPDKVQSMKRRMVIMSEVGTTHTLSIDAVKQLTGNDLQSHRELYSNVYVTGRPKFTPYISTNEVPSIPNIDKATSSRIVVIPFNSPQTPERITPDKDVKNNKAILAGVFRWLIEGLELYLAEGLSYDKWEPIVKEEVTEFVEEASTFVEFFNSTFVLSKGATIDEDSAFKEWQAWNVSEGGNSDLSRREFRRKLKQTQGVKVRRTTRKLDGASRNVYVIDGVDFGWRA